MHKVIAGTVAVVSVLLAQQVWAASITGVVSSISGRTATINNVVLTFPPATGGQIDLMAGVQAGDSWAVIYDPAVTPGAANTVTQATAVLPPAHDDEAD